MASEGNITHFSITTDTMIRAILIGLSVFLLWFLRDLFLVVLTSIVIASFIESAIPHFKKAKINRILAIVIMYAGTLLILAGLFYLFAPLLITEVYNFSSFLSSYLPGVSWLNYFQNEAFSGAKDIVGSLSGDFSVSGLLSISKEFILNLSGGFFNALSVAFDGIFNFVLIIVISFYLSIQEKGIENFLRVVVPIRYEDYVVDLWDRSSKKIALWVKGQVVLGIVVAVLIYLVLSLLGIQYALLLAIIAGVMELVPYGMLVAAIPAFSFSYISGGLSSALMVMGAYLIIHQFEVFLFAPLIIEKVVGLSPVVIILSALIGFELGGIWGILLAIPVAVVAMELVNDIEKDKILARNAKK
ncbi:AI-2E family transporter [Candidatus Nomurabacteria bacterium]|nr:AI-2E family transporter [Candidatus Nomurabacteria bacterium]